MSNDQITITHHPATDIAPRHWRSSDGFLSLDGASWIEINPEFMGPHQTAFFSQILNPKPVRAKVGDRVRSNNTGKEYIVKSVNGGFVGGIDDSCCIRHGDYTIVDPPQPLTAKGSEITQKDGVWERSDRTVRVLIADGDISVVLCGDQDAPGYCGGWWKDIDGFEDLSFAHISDDPRDLTDWEVE